jgi:hypothetical protein
MGHTTANHGAEGRVVEPSFWIIDSFIGFSFGRGRVTWWWGGRRGCGGGDRGGALGLSSLLSSNVSLSLSGESLVGGCPDVARRACQDGRGPQSSGWSGSGVEGWRRRLTS